MSPAWSIRRRDQHGRAFHICVDGDLTGGSVPKTADLFVARRVGDHFERLPTAPGSMANLNTSALEYAGRHSNDGLECLHNG